MESQAQLIAVAPACLGTALSPHVFVLEKQDIRLMLTADLNRTLREHRGAVAAVPAFTEAEVSVISSLRAAFPGQAVLGVVDDVSGSQTYAAMHAGAHGVLNLQLPPARAVTVIHRQAARVALGAPEGPDAGPALSVSDFAVLEMVIEARSTREMARRFYCSERTMYRRLRDIYGHIGVDGRRGLLELLATRQRAFS
ncbi:helix-turn-helix transcriptional regulator [Amycolatopsis sp. NPDC003865]